MAVLGLDGVAALPLPGAAVPGHALGSMGALGTVGSGAGFGTIGSIGTVGVILGPDFGTLGVGRVADGAVDSLRLILVSAFTRIAGSGWVGGGSELVLGLDIFGAIVALVVRGVGGELLGAFGQALALDFAGSALTGSVLDAGVLGVGRNLDQVLVLGSGTAGTMPSTHTGSGACHGVGAFLGAGYGGEGGEGGYLGCGAALSVGAGLGLDMAGGIALSSSVWPCLVWVSCGVSLVLGKVAHLGAFWYFGADFESSAHAVSRGSWVCSCWL